MKKILFYFYLVGLIITMIDTKTGIVYFLCIGSFHLITWMEVTYFPKSSKRKP